MKWIVVGLSIALVITLITSATFMGLFFSNSQKKIRKNAREQAKKDRQQIVGQGYKEINNEKKRLKIESEENKVFIAQERNYLEVEKESLNQVRKAIVKQELSLEEMKKLLFLKEEELVKLNDNLISELEKVSQLSVEDASKELLDAIKLKNAKEMNDYVRYKELEIYKTMKNKATDIVLLAMEKISTDFVNERVTSVIKIPDEQMKGRIIGKDGRNIKTFEQYAGVDIVIDDTPDLIMVSSFNPIRREIAFRTLNKLISDGRIQPIRIEQELKEQESLLSDIILEIGQKTVEELEIVNMDIELVSLIGRLKFSTSYNQNVLLHSIEVAQLSATIAAELGLNIQDAKRAGLLHDIGKAVDFEQEGNHVELGVEIAKRYGENETIINTIASHHEDEKKLTPIAAIVSIADTISASRTGARNEQIETYVKRIREIEQICDEIPGVVKSYALQSGRKVQVIVDPAFVSDYELNELTNKIAEKLKDVAVPGDVNLVVIRERRATKIIK